jgi:hypothetical protein
VGRNHDHDARRSFRAVPIHALIAERPTLVRYLALPVKTVVLLGAGGFTVHYEESMRVVAKGSYIAALEERGRGELDLESDEDIRSLVDQGKRDDAVDLAIEKYTSTYTRVSPTIDAMFEKSVPARVEGASSDSIVVGTLSELDRELIAMIESGAKIQAVMKCRTAMRIGLADAKRYVEALEARLGRTH